jgi:site-specific recombinase XerC
MSSDRYTPQPIRLALIQALAKAKPPLKPKEIRDRAAKLILRHQPSGHLSIYVELGRGKRERLCDARRIADPNSTLTLAMVKDQAQKLRGQHVDGKDFAGERRAQRAIPTLKAYLEKTYGPWVKQNRRSGAATLARLESCFIEDLGNDRLNAITPARLEPWRARRQRDGVKPETINRDIVGLRAALSRGVKLEILLKNPLTGVELAEVDPHKQEVRALTAAEKQRLIDSLSARDDKKRAERASANAWREERGYELLPPIGKFADALTPAVIVALETGLRRSEEFRLEWPAIDFDEKAIRVAGTTVKTYETRDIPLNSFAHKTLRDWWLQCGQPDDGAVFIVRGERVSNLKRSYQAVLSAAGIKRISANGQRVNWHSLRHTFGSLLGAASADPVTLMKLMGHANLETTQRYLHTDADRKRAAVEALSTRAS